MLDAPASILLAALALASPAADAPADTLKEIIVTASRIPESILRAPAAVSIVDRGSMADTRGLSLADVLGGVPGVVAQSRSGAQDTRVTIRGFGARGNGERSNTGTLRGIRVLVDGIPLTEPDGRTSLDLIDLGSTSRIEISRSNASALYGNASGGVLNLRSNLGPPAPFVELRARAGSFGYHREQIVAGFPVGDRGSGTASVLNSTFDGWREHSGSSSLQAQVRLETALGGGDRLGVLFDAASNLNRFPGPLTAAQADSAPEQANARFAERDERRHNRIGRVALTFDHDLSPDHDLGLAVFVEPKVLERSERNRFRDFNRTHLGGSATTSWRAQPRPGLATRLGAGFDEAWQDGSILFYDLAPGGGRGTELKANKREAANSAGAFVEGELRWHERWSLRGALRFDAVTFIAEDRTKPELDAEKTFTRLTPKAALGYEAGRHFLYAALGGGVETPAFNEIDPPAPYDTLTSLNPFLDPMRSTTYEVGARGVLAPRAGTLSLGRLRYDLAAYWIEVQDEIVPLDGGAYFLTAGRSRRRGLELGLDWLLTGRLRLAGALTLSENRFLDYESDRGDFAGHETPGLPAAQLNAGARYAVGAGITGELAVEYSDDYFADDANTARAGAYTLLDATVGWTRALGRHSVHAFVGAHNIADRRHVASVFLNGLNGEFFEPGLGRHWSSGLTWRWR